MRLISKSSFKVDIRGRFIRFGSPGHACLSARLQFENSRAMEGHHMANSRIPYILVVRGLNNILITRTAVVDLAAYFGVCMRGRQMEMFRVWLHPIKLDECGRPWKKAKQKLLGCSVPLHYRDHNIAATLQNRWPTAFLSRNTAPLLPIPLIPKAVIMTHLNVRPRGVFGRIQGWTRGPIQWRL